MGENGCTNWYYNLERGNWIMYDIERLKSEITEVCEKADCKLLVPVLINGRLSRTLARVMYQRVGGTCRATAFEFSKMYLENSDDAAIHQTLLHECAHYISWYRTRECHGHDAYFRQICAEIGCIDDRAISKTEGLKSAEQAYKYAVYCSNCGYLGGYSRMTKTLKYIGLCRCKKCGNYTLTYKQNR